MVVEQKPSKEVPLVQPQAILSDFSWVLLHPKNRVYQGSLNGLNRQMGGEEGMGEYPFFEYFELNTELLRYLAIIKERVKIPIYMFTTDAIQERPELKRELESLFDRIISGREIVARGASQAETLDAVKTDPKSYRFIAEDIHISPQELLFIDDKAANLDAAHKEGYQVLQYKRTPTMEESNAKILEELKRIFGELPFDEDKIK